MKFPAKPKLNDIRHTGFRPQVVGCFVFESSLLFVYSKEHDLWQLPQGGIDNNETVEQAFWREMQEELGKNFIDSCERHIELFGDDKIEFPYEAQGSRELITDEGENVIMKGKKYFFILCKVKSDIIDITKTEFQNYKWCDFETALDTADKIYQKGKKRIVNSIIILLKNKKIL